MIKKHRVCILIGLFVLVIGCPRTDIVVPAPVVPPDIVWCEPGCKHLQSLTGRDGHPGCEEGRSIDLVGGDILTCKEFCERTLKEGRNLYPSCFVKVNKCEEIEEYRKLDKPCSEQ